jgi:hypothetical protein
MFVYPSLVESRCPCRDVGEAILVGSLRPIWTARETLGGRTLERPSCGGFAPTAETTLFPAYSARSRRLLTSSARLDNDANCYQYGGTYSIPGAHKSSVMRTSNDFNF